MAKAISQEMGAPITLATRAQARAGLGHIKAFIAVLKDFEFEHSLRDDARNEHIVYEPICRSEEHTSELQSLMRISYAVFCLKKKKQTKKHTHIQHQHKISHQHNYYKNI